MYPLIAGLSSKGRRDGAYFAFWDVVQFTLNGLVFFFVGASVVNFFIRQGGKGGCGHKCLDASRPLALPAYPHAGPHPHRSTRHRLASFLPVPAVRL